MKKILLVFVFIFVTVTFGFSQAILQIEAPLNNGSTTQQRAPNGTAAQVYMRACALVLANELTNLPSGSTISNFGFTLSTGTSGTPVSGNFTVYLQNTADITYLKGTNWASIPTGMTSVFANVMTIPISAGTTSILITLSTPFVYTGGGLYVAYDWYCAGPYTSGTIATYLAESAVLNPGCASAASATSAPTVLANTAFRPSFLFQAANTNTNDIQIQGIEANGKVPFILNQAQTVRAMVKNGSNQTNTNIQVNLSVSGANTFNSNLSISSLASGASTLVTFTNYTPVNSGLNTISVSVNSDQNNSNNSLTFAQDVTCNYLAGNPGAGSYTSGAVGYGAGAGIIGTQIYNAISANLTGINFAISTNTVIGVQIYGVLMNTAGAILATTNTLTVGNQHLGSFYEFEFLNAQSLTAATNYVIGMAQMTGAAAYYPAGTQATNYLPQNMYLTAAIGGGVLTPLPTNFGYFGIEAIYQHTANVSISASPTVLCIGSTSTLQALGAVNAYTWSSGSNASSITVSPNVNTSYSVVSTNSIGCKSKANFALSVSPLPNVNVSSSSASVCVGSSVGLTASGAINYTWSTGANGNNITANPSINTTYSVLGENANGCVNSNSINITVSEPLFAVSSNTFVCGDLPITLTVTGQPNYTYLWSNNSPFPSITVTLSSNSVYSVTATDPNLCSKTLTVSVNVNPLPNVLASSSTSNICRNEAINLMASGANSYSWSTSETTPTIVISHSNSGTFTYSVTGTSTNNCSNTATISIKVFACVGLQDYAKSDTGVQIYPNPAQHYLIVEFDKPQTFELQIFNVAGQEVLKKLLIEKHNQIELDQLAKGQYLLKFILDGELKFSRNILKE